MYILGSGCGWIPDAPIKFLSNIIDIIKILTPVVLIIMGVISFGKAIMSQKEDEIKKAQGSFIKKIISGAAVFFVIVFAEWVMNILSNAGATTNDAIRCVNTVLNGTYSADDKDYYNPGNSTTKATTEKTQSTSINMLSDSTCWAQVQTISGYEGYSSKEKCQDLVKKQNPEWDDFDANLFCEDLCNKNPYVQINKYPTTNVPGIGDVPITPMFPNLTTEPTESSTILDQLNGSLLNELIGPLGQTTDKVLLGEQIQQSYKDNDCWDDSQFEEMNVYGYNSCWEKIFYNSKADPNYNSVATIWDDDTLMTEAKKQCMNLCDNVNRNK